LGPLEWANGQVPHPLGGQLKVQVRKLASGRIEGVVSVPAGVTALLKANGSTATLLAGENHFS
jgi:hypothetical protein